MSRVPPLRLALALLLPLCSCDGGDGTGTTDSRDSQACLDQESTCDQVDDDCDGLVDEGLVLTVWADSDRDGHGDPASPLETCALGDGQADNANDCDDEDPDVHPTATELCNDVDDDCDEQIDEALSSTWYTDADSDGYGDDATAVDTCDPGEDLVDQGGDCDDTDSGANPGETEICNGVDDNCDERVDEDLAGTCGDAPLSSCLEVLGAWPEASDGLFWIDPTDTEPVQVHCDLAAGGWTLVYRGTNAGGLIENGVVEAPEALGETPITPSSEGNHKLHDDVINALRTGSVENDLKVVVTIDGTALTPAYHPSACVLQSGTDLDASDLCNESTTVGPNETSRSQSGHTGSLTRWYVDYEVGYIWGAVGTHVGPIDGGTGLGQAPGTYCTWYDSRTCPSETALEIWAL